jgi:hypothetical protein
MRSVATIPEFTIHDTTEPETISHDTTDPEAILSEAEVDIISFWVFDDLAISHLSQAPNTLEPARITIITTVHTTILARVTDE